MSHDEARGLLTDRLLDELGPEERARLEAHLEECPECREAAREWSSAWDALDALDSAAMQSAAHVRFGRRLERERSRRRIAGRFRAVAVVALLLGAGLVGRTLVPDAATDRPARSGESPRFLLILRGDEPGRTRPEERLFEEYGAWAARLAEAGALVSAEALDSTAGWVAPETVSDPAAAPVSGFFLVEAPSLDSALAVARASPHAAYGGLIEVRRILRRR